MKMLKSMTLLLLLILTLSSLLWGQAQASQALNIVYTVRSGDTLWILSQRFGTTVAAIKAASGYWSDNLNVGQKLKIPVKADDPRVYVVIWGDTLWKIAQKYNTTVQELKALNSLTLDALYPGQVLLVPEGKKSSFRLDLTSEEMELLAKLVQAEAGGEIYEGMVAVAAVVINRVKDPRFPNTIQGVIYEPWAFEPVSNGWINRPATQAARNASIDALKGWDPTGGALFFYNPALTSHPWMLQRPIIKRIGNHVFAK